MLYFAQNFLTGIGGENHRSQFGQVVNRREAFNNQQKHMRQLHSNAAAVIPRDVYREFDNQTKEIMRADNQTLLNDLMPLARALPVGKLEHIHRRASDSGIVTTSLGGQPTNVIDKTAYDYDSSIKVIHQAAFGRDWMEIEGQRSEGFDAMVDDQANTVRAIRDAMVDHFYEGADVSFNGTTAYGIKNSTKTVDVDLDAGGLNINFATSTDPAAIRTAWIAMRDNLRITNNVSQPITYYISAEIESNFEQYYGTAAGDSGKTMRQTLMELAGTADIKMDRHLSGNEVVGVVLDSEFIRPLVGMAVTTTPITRTDPMDQYRQLVWANVGLEIRSDYTGKSGVLFAREIA